MGVVVIEDVVSGVEDEFDEVIEVCVFFVVVLVDELVLFFLREVLRYWHEEGEFGGKWSLEGFAFGL